MSKSSPSYWLSPVSLSTTIYPTFRLPMQYIFFSHKHNDYYSPFHQYCTISQSDTKLTSPPQRHPNRPNHQNRLQHHRSLRRHAPSPQRPPQNRNPLPRRRNRNLAKQPTNRRSARRKRLLHPHPRSFQRRPTLPQSSRWIRSYGLVDERDRWE
jgi:hypothetical protein